MATKLNILLIDENIADRIITEEILNEVGIPFHLNHIPSLQDAISFLCKEKEFINAEKPDLIVLDSGLLYRSYEIWTKQIRSDERFNKIPSIALLLFKDEESFFRARNLPVDCYLIKPIDLMETGSFKNALREFMENMVCINRN